MKATDHQTCKKPYKKPLVTRVGLKVEQNVLQDCHGFNFNKSPYDELDCFEALTPCSKSPTL